MSEVKARLLTVREVAERLKMSERTIYNSISRDAKNPFPVRPVRIRRLVRFREQDVDKYIESL